MTIKPSMVGFFKAFSGVCLCLYFMAIAAGHYGGFFEIPAQWHMLLGILVAFLITALHSLIFAIFTGSGKDTRLLVQDLGMDSSYVKRMKAFKRELFPPALYAIFWVVLTAVIGGALGSSANPIVRWGHFLLAWFTFFYNVKVILKENKGVAENAELLRLVNADSSRRSSELPPIPATEHGLEKEFPGAEAYEWGTHVYALGKFLCFMGYNVWLFFIYIRFIMGHQDLSVWPFVIAFVLFVGVGYYLRWRYQVFRPGLRGPFLSKQDLQAGG